MQHRQLASMRALLSYKDKQPFDSEWAVPQLFVTDDANEAVGGRTGWGCLYCSAMYCTSPYQLCVSMHHSISWICFTLLACLEGLIVEHP